VCAKELNYPNIGPIPAQQTLISAPRRPTAVLVGRINQPLSQFYRAGLELKQLDAGREIAGQQVRAQRQSVINNVKQSSWSKRKVAVQSPAPAWSSWARRSATQSLCWKV